MHPFDVTKVRRLAEALYDIGAGRLMTTAGLEHQVAELMVCLRDDCCAVGAGSVLDSLLSTADDRFGIAWMEQRIVTALAKRRNGVAVSSPVSLARPGYRRVHEGRRDQDSEST